MMYPLKDQELDNLMSSSTIAIKKLERQTEVVQWISIVLSTCAIIISLVLIIC